MPKATYIRSKQRFELRTVPPADENDEQGYIVVQQLTYGEVLTRREIGLRWMANEQTAETELATMQRAIVGFDFARCIVEHNLQDEYGAKLEFADPRVFDIIDPRVASEIEQILDNLHEFKPEVVSKDFLQQSTASQTPKETDSPEPESEEKLQKTK